MKIDKRKKYVLVFDTETIGGVKFPIGCYNIGGCIADKKGNIYDKFDFFVSEVLFNFRKELNTCYYSDKLSEYGNKFLSGSLDILPFEKIRYIITELLYTYNIKEVWAYNAAFDIKALRNSLYNFVGIKSEFFPPHIKIKCVMKFATQVLLPRPTYINYCLDNGFLTEKGNIKTSAEVVFRYLINNEEFEEEHTALSDSLIETAILVKCWKQHKKAVDVSKINYNGWRIPTSWAKENNYF